MHSCYKITRKKKKKNEIQEQAKLQDVTIKLNSLSVKKY